MRLDTVMIAVLSLVFTLVTVGSNPLPSPSFCGHNPQTTPNTAQCVYGHTRDPCNNIVCFKGPSEIAVANTIDMELVLKGLCVPTAIDVRVARSKHLHVGMTENAFGSIVLSQNSISSHYK